MSIELLVVYVDTAILPTLPDLLLGRGARKWIGDQDDVLQRPESRLEKVSPTGASCTGMLLSMTTTNQSRAREGGIDGLRIGAEIRTRRRALYLTQADLASLASTSITTVQHFEAGIVPSKRASGAFARVLGALDERECGK
jgi:DNA-binding transcriptional regulator YiaG